MRPVRIALVLLLAPFLVAPASAQDGPTAPPAAGGKDPSKNKKEDEDGATEEEGAEEEKPAKGDETADKGEGDKGEGDKDAEKEDAEKAPEEPPAWKLPDRNRRRLERSLERYLVPGRYKRSRALDKLERMAERKIDGHHFLEDVGAIADIANKARTFNPKAGRRGRIETIEVAPDVHGFPGGIGTVRYSIRLPRGYTDRELWPLILALPDNKEWPDPEKYIEKAWAENEKVAESYIIVVPHPQSKGAEWTQEKSYARAMITLRHVSGTFDQDKRTGGPATDMMRIFVDGGDAAAVTAARFPGMFAGVIIRHGDGRVPGGVNLRDGAAGALPPAYFVYSTKSRFERKLVETYAPVSTNSVAVEDDDNGLVDIAAIADWMEKVAKERKTQPREIDYTIRDASFQRAWWLTILRYDSAVEPAPWISAKADRARNVIRVEVRGVTRFEVNLNDAIVDLNRPLDIIVVEEDREYPFVEGAELDRSTARALSGLVQSNHPWRVYAVRLTVDVPELRAAWRAAKDKKAAAEAKDKNKKKTNVEVVSGEAGPVRR